MSTGPSSTPTVEKLDLSDHEFDVPCDTHNTRKGRCTKPAAWILVLRPHCRSLPGAQYLICETHYQYVINGGTAICFTCGDRGIVVRDLVAQLERIKR